MNPNVTDYFFNVPDTTDVDTLAAPVLDYMRSHWVEYPRFPALTTHAVIGRAILHIRFDQRLTVAEVEATLSQLGLDWVVVFIRSAYKVVPVVIDQDEFGNDIIDMQYDTIMPCDKGDMLQYCDNIVDGYDINLEPIIRLPTLLDTLYFPMYAGTDPVVL